MKLRQKYKLLKKKLEATDITPVFVKNVYADIERYLAITVIKCDNYEFPDESEKLKCLEEIFYSKFKTSIIKNMKIERVGEAYSYQEQYKAEIMMIDRNKID